MLFIRCLLLLYLTMASAPALPGRNQKKRPNCSKSWNASDFPYETDYNDHFETPLQAYQDVKPLIDWLARTISSSSSSEGGKSPRHVRLYDPYYCNGRTAVLLRDQLGYTNVVHEKRDFYRDIRNHTVPAYDILITNPPYSDAHKIDCLDFCFRQLRSSNKPFMLLMPAYTASKHYYRKHCSRKKDVGNDGGEGDEGLETEEVVYLVPNQDYHYDHPENTGKEQSPFASLWFCGLGRDRAVALRRFWDGASSSRTTAVTAPPTLAASLAELESKKVVSLQNRPNPRQRRKRHRKQLLGVAAEEPEPQEPRSPPGAAQQKHTQPAPTTNHHCSSSQSTSLDVDADRPTAVHRKKKKSKYRDPSGKRAKGRF